MTGRSRHRRLGSSGRAAADPATEEVGVRAAAFSCAALDHIGNSGPALYPTMTATSSPSHRLRTLGPPLTPASPYQCTCPPVPLSGRTTSRHETVAARPSSATAGRPTARLAGACSDRPESASDRPGTRARRTHLVRLHRQRAAAAATPTSRWNY